ncbi:MAG: hypothetical protein AAB222_02950 [Candidatus Binatota bacterium]
MKSLISVAALLLIYMVFTLSSCAVQEEMTAPAKPAAPPVMEAKKAPPAEKAPAVKAKALKAKGDVGLLDVEKNYLILVTKEGKLITVDFDAKTKVTKVSPTPSKMEDIGLGSSASVEYQSKGEKKIITKVEYKGAKGGD